MVQTVDPAAQQRRLLPVLPARCDLPLRLGILSYIDFTRVEEQAEKIETLVTAIRRRSTARRQSTVTEITSPPFAIPTGALSPDSPIYIERHHDHTMRQQVAYEGSTTVVEGARQMGKSSLLARALAHVRAQQYRVIDMDFQELDTQCLSDLGTLLRYLADLLYERLNVVVSPEETWQGLGGHKDKLTAFLRNYVLQGAQSCLIRPTRIVGPFADHLQHHRQRLTSDAELQRGMKQVMMNGNCPNHEVFLRLRSLGLITGVSHHAAAPRCRLYAAYFQRVLS